jgi:hypothetical protein
MVDAVVYAESTRLTNTGSDDTCADDETHWVELYWDI